MEEFAQLVGVRPAHKYAPLAQHVRALRLLARGSTHGIADVETCIRRQVAFALLGNVDAHLKNWAIVYVPDGRHFRLAPAYDVVCVTQFFGAEPREYAINRQIDKMMRTWDLAYFEQLATEAGVLEPRQTQTWVRETVAAAQSLPA